MFVICITVLTVSFIIFCFFRIKSQKIPVINPLKTVSIETFLKKADNGDLIFLCGDSFGEDILRWASGSEFSHVGIIFKDIDGSLYIYESDIGQKVKRGIRIIKLSEKLKRHKGYKVGAWRKLQGERPTSTQFMIHVTNHLSKPFDDQFISWFLPIKVSDGYFCSELVAKILQDFGILKTNKLSHNYSPNDLYTEMENYSSPLTFVFD